MLGRADPRGPHGQDEGESAKCPQGGADKLPGKKGHRGWQYLDQTWEGGQDRAVRVEVEGVQVKAPLARAPGGKSEAGLGRT